MDTDGSSSAPLRVEVGSVLVRQNKFVPSKMSLEDGRGFKAGKGGGRQKKPSWRARRDEKTKPGDRSQAQLEPVVPILTLTKYKLFRLWRPHAHCSGSTKDMFVLSHGQTQRSWGVLLTFVSVCTCVWLQWRYILVFGFSPLFQMYPFWLLTVLCRIYASTASIRQHLRSLRACAAL